ncbi:hypothetical protein ACOSP7_013471 [Xanthoceras sorbifolium]
MAAHYCSLIIHVNDRVYLNYPKSPLESLRRRESKSRLPLESCEIGLRDLATPGQVAASDRVSLGFQIEHLPSRLGQMLGLRDLSSGEPSSKALHKNDWNRQKSPKRPKTYSLKENIKNTR